MLDVSKFVGLRAADVDVLLSVTNPQKAKPLKACIPVGCFICYLSVHWFRCLKIVELIKKINIFKLLQTTLRSKEKRKKKQKKQ